MNLGSIVRCPRPTIFNDSLGALIALRIDPSEATFPRSALGNVAKNLRREMTEYLKMGYLLHSGNAQDAPMRGANAHPRIQDLVAT